MGLDDRALATSEIRCHGDCYCDELPAGLKLPFRLRACWAVHSPVGCRVTPRMRMRRVACSITASRKLPEITALIERSELVRSCIECAARCECPNLNEGPLFDDPPLMPRHGSDRGPRPRCGAEVEPPVVSRRVPRLPCLP